MNARKDFFFVREPWVMKILPLVFSSSIALNAEALVYSSNIQFKTTSMRVEAKDFQNHVKLPALEIVQEPAPQRAPELEKKLQAINPQPNTAPTHSVEENIQTNLRGKIPTRSPSQARIFVFDEEALLNGSIQPIANAQVSLIKPGLNVGRGILTSKAGVASIPYPFTESVRFFVNAPGYTTGMGYATLGEVTFVPLVSERRTSSLVRSLSLNVPAGQLALVGRLVDSNLSGLEEAQLEFAETQTQNIYSGPFFGGIHGYFTHDYKQTDPLGAFIVNGVSRTRHNIKVLSKKHKIPGFSIDLTGIPDNIRFLSLALQNGAAINLPSSVVDGEFFDRPECGITTTLSNHLKAFIPAEDSSLWVESRRRPVVNDLKVSPNKNCGYIPTQLSKSANAESFPPVIGLFTQTQINSLISILNRNWVPSESLVLGHVYPQKGAKDQSILREVSVSILDSQAERPRQARIYYFDENNNLDPRQRATNAHHQNFLVLGLEDGEYHFVYTDAQNGSGLGIQVVRVQSGAVTQVDF